MTVVMVVFSAIILLAFQSPPAVTGHGSMKRLMDEFGYLNRANVPIDSRPQSAGLSNTADVLGVPSTKLETGEAKSMLGANEGANNDDRLKYFKASSISSGGRSMAAQERDAEYKSGSSTSETRTAGDNAAGNCPCMQKSNQGGANSRSMERSQESSVDRETHNSSGESRLSARVEAGETHQRISDVDTTNNGGFTFTSRKSKGGRTMTDDQEEDTVSMKNNTNTNTNSSSTQQLSAVTASNTTEVGSKTLISHMTSKTVDDDTAGSGSAMKTRSQESALATSLSSTSNHTTSSLVTLNSTITNITVTDVNSAIKVTTNASEVTELALTRASVKTSPDFTTNSSVTTQAVPCSRDPEAGSIKTAQNSTVSLIMNNTSGTGSESSELNVRETVQFSTSPTTETIRGSTPATNVLERTVEPSSFTTTTTTTTTTGMPINNLALKEKEQTAQHNPLTASSTLITINSVSDSTDATLVTDTNKAQIHTSLQNTTEALATTTYSNVNGCANGTSSNSSESMTAKLEDRRSSHTTVNVAKENVDSAGQTMRQESLRSATFQTGCQCSAPSCSETTVQNLLKVQIGASCEGKAYCEEVQNYPEQLIENIMANLAGDELLKGFLRNDTDVSHKYSKPFVTDEFPVCPTSIEKVAPKAVTTTGGQWIYAVNTKKFPQSIIVEKCIHTNRCSMVPETITSRCAQKLIRVEILTIDSNSLLRVETVSIPSSCVCLYKGDKRF